MARYRMTLGDGISAMSGTAQDDAGAIREAGIAACDILGDELREGRCPAAVTITITTSGGRSLGAVRVTGTMEEAPAGRGCPGHARAALRPAVPDPAGGVRPHHC